MKLSKRVLLKLKNKNKKLKPQKFKRLKRESLRGLVKGTQDRPRLSVYRSNENIYAQIIDGNGDKVLASASTLDRELRKDMKTTGNASAASIIGKTVAERAKAAGISSVAFDRSGFKYHGRVKALADAARESGLEF